MGVYLGKDKVSTYFKEYLVEPSEFDLVPLEINPTGVLQIFTPQNGQYFNSVTVNGDANLTPGNIRQGVSIYGVAGSYNPQYNVSLKSETINPSQTLQTIYVPNGYDGFGTLTVNPVTASIDSDIIPENIKVGVNILGVTGTLVEGGTPASGTIELTTNGEHDVSRFATAYVNVPNTGISAQELAAQGYVIPHGEYNITANGAYPIGEYETVRVNVPVPSGYMQTPTQTLEINANSNGTVTRDVTNYATVNVNFQIPSTYVQPTGTKQISSNGEVDVTSYKYVNVNVASAKPEQTKTVTPSKSAQTVLPDSGYALSRVAVSAIPSQYIVPSGSYPSTIETNGTYDVKNYETVTINVPGESHIFLYSPEQPGASVGTVWFKPIS